MNLCTSELITFRNDKTARSGILTNPLWSSFVTRQNPDSLMALKWCVEWGVIPEKDAAKASARLEKLKLVHKEKLKRRGVGAPVLLEKKEKKIKKENGSSSKSKPTKSVVESDDDQSDD